MTYTAVRVYITKYALTRGIFTVLAEVALGDSQMVVDRSGRHPQYYHGEGSQWHRSKESAIAKAEAMRKARVKSLQQSLAKVKSLDFSLAIGGEP